MPVLNPAGHENSVSQAELVFRGEQINCLSLRSACHRGTFRFCAYPFICDRYGSEQRIHCICLGAIGTTSVLDTIVMCAVFLICMKRNLSHELRVWVQASTLTHMHVVGSLGRDLAQMADLSVDSLLQELVMMSLLCLHERIGEKEKSSLEVWLAPGLEAILVSTSQ